MILVTATIKSMTPQELERIKTLLEIKKHSIKINFNSGYQLDFLAVYEERMWITILLKIIIQEIQRRVTGHDTC